MYTQQQARDKVLKIIDHMEPCDLRDRLRRELRRNSDTGSTGRARRREFDERVKQWSRSHLVASFDADVPGVMGVEAWDAFRKAVLNPQLPNGAHMFGQRAFYAALRGAGLNVDRFGTHTYVCGVELA